MDKIKEIREFMTDLTDKYWEVRKRFKTEPCLDSECLAGMSDDEVIALYERWDKQKHFTPGTTLYEWEKEFYEKETGKEYILKSLTFKK